MLGFGAVPAAAVVYLRAKMPESPRFQARVQGEAERAASQLAVFSEGAVALPVHGAASPAGPDRATHPPRPRCPPRDCAAWVCGPFSPTGAHS